MIAASRHFLVIEPTPRARDYLLRRLRQRGHRVTTAVAAGGSVPNDVVDCWFCVDPMSREAVEEIRARNAADPFSGIICYQQAAVEFANRLTQVLGLAPIWRDSKLNVKSKA